MVASNYSVADIAAKIANCPTPASTWAPVAVADLIKQVERALHGRQAA